MPLSKAKVEVPLRVRALRLLARREYSRLELERKLALYTDDAKEIAALLADFEQRGWISERRVVEQVRAVRRRRFGAQRIVQELRGKGIGEEAIAATLAELQQGDLAAAREVWRRKFGKLPNGLAERARQVRFLQSRGFSAETALRVLRTADETD